MWVREKDQLCRSFQKKMQWQFIVSVPPGKIVWVHASVADVGA